MLFSEKTITLRDGRRAILKSPEVADAAQLLDYIRTSCGETDFLARYPEEWTTTAEQEEAWCQRLRTAPDTLAITCYVDGVIAGNCEINFNRRIKTAHRAVVAIAVLKQYWSLGIGTAMFEELITAARARDVEILELEFVEGNDRARRLYERFGFRVVAEIPDAYRLKDGRYLKGVHMHKRM